MSVINVTNVGVLDNPCKFDNPFQFDISFECLAEINEDIEWKLVYVGSAESDDHDQELDSVLVGPMQMGPYKIVFQADPPDAARIPTADLLGVTVILLSCHYREKEFIRVGYYVNTEYDSPELNESPPEVPQYERLVRNILADKPRVTRYQIDWSDSPTGEQQPQQQEELQQQQQQQVLQQQQDQQHMQQEAQVMQQQHQQAQHAQLLAQQQQQAQQHLQGQPSMEQPPQDAIMQQ